MERTSTTPRFYYKVTSLVWLKCHCAMQKTPPPTHGPHRGNNTMLRLSPPKHVTFFISIAVAIIAVIIHYAKIDIPHIHSGFVILLIGYLVLVAGNVLDGF